MEAKTEKIKKGSQLNRPTLFIAVGAATILIAAPFAARKSNFIVNTTGSMKYGIYEKIAKKDLSRGETVGLCLPTSIATLGKREGILVQGRCPDKTIPLLKELIAVPGDEVTVSTKEIMVNGKRYPAPVKDFSHDGIKLNRLVKSGHYKTDGYWFYGANAPKRSWDSRYFGPLQREAIIGSFKSVITFG